MKIKQSIISVAVVCLVAATAVAGEGKLLNFSNRKLTDTVRTDSINQQEQSVPENSVIDEVIWVVGDEPILKSDVEAMRMQGLAEGISFGSDPDCTIPEQLAVQKLFLHQAN